MPIVLIIWVVFVVLTVWPARKLVRKNKHFLPWVWIVYILGTKLVLYFEFSRFIEAMG